MNRRSKIIVSITGIAIVSLFLIALTYGYYLTKIKGNSNSKSITATTDNLELVYGDDDGSIIGDGEVITPNTTFDPKTFSVTNDGTGTVSYSVVLDNVNITNVSTGDETSFESNDFVYTLTCTSGCNGVSDETTLPLYDNGILVSNSIDGGEKQTYSITITYKDTGVDQSNDMNKSLSARINIVSFNLYERDKSTLAYNIVNNALNVSSENKENGYAEFRATPVSGIGTSISGKNYTTTITESTATISSVSTTYAEYYWTYADGYTVDEKNGFTLTGVHTCKYSECYSSLAGKYLVSNSASSNGYSVNSPVSTTGLTTIYKVTTAETSATSSVSLVEYSISTIDVDENILTIADDDYGKSYYYRGNVENNYVTFANMCWRVVRIAGDGSIKLILEDQDEECSTTMNGNWDIATKNYGSTYDDTTSQYKINYLNGGGIADNLKDFQESKLNSFQTKIKSGDWCYDDTAYQDSRGTTLITDTSTYYANNTFFYYGANTRLYNKKQPSLKCAGTNMTKFGDNTTDMYVGALTADEIVLAGGKAGSSNINYYLINNYQKDNSKYYWSFSPSFFSSNEDYAFYVKYDGKLLNAHVFYEGLYNYDGSARPAINLKSGTEFDSGDGTIENPYIVN